MRERTCFEKPLNQNDCRSVIYRSARDLQKTATLPNGWEVITRQSLCERTQMTYHLFNAGGYHIVSQFELSFAKTSGGIRQVKITQNESVVAGYPTFLKSMYPFSTSVRTSWTRSVCPTSSFSKPVTSLPSTGGWRMRTHVPFSDAPVTSASNCSPILDSRSIAAGAGRAMKRSPSR